MSGIYIGGHSLGAARAFLYAYSRVKRGLRVDGIICCGSPNPGNDVIGYALSGIPIFSLKNRRDLITDVPVDIELFGEEYVQPVPFDEIDEPAKRGDPWGLLSDHHVELYQAGAAKLPSPPGQPSIADAVDQIARLYDTVEGWDWINPVDGAYWGMHKFASGARLMIARGTTTRLDWWNDFDAVQIPAMGAQVSQGFWAGVANVQDQLDAALA